MKKNNTGTVLFDLDGTILNTLDDIAATVNYVLGKLHYPEKSDAKVLSAVGGGVRRALARLMFESDDIDNAANAEELDTAHGLFLTHYGEHLTEHTCPYPGVVELLRRLCRDGYKIGVVSNKIDRYTRVLAEEFFYDSVGFAIGLRPDMPPKPAPDTALEALRALGGALDSTVFVGDSDVDYLTAKNIGIPCVLVSWGYRSREELHAVGATDGIIAHTADEVYGLITSITSFTTG